MIKLSIIAAAAALLLALPADARADDCLFAGGSNLLVIDLVLDDGTTDVGDILFKCIDIEDRLEVTITTEPTITFDGYSYNSFFLKSIVDLVAVPNAPNDCRNRMANDGYTSRNGGPRVGTADLTSTMSTKKNAASWKHVHIFTLPPPIHDDFCLVVVANLYNADGSNARRTDGHAPQYTGYPAVPPAIFFKAKNSHAFIPMQP